MRFNVFRLLQRDNPQAPPFFGEGAGFAHRIFSAGEGQAVVLLFLLFSACTPRPQPIDFGSDQCHHCKMTIADHRYGAELVTNKGKVFKYDAVECMVSSVFKDKMIDTSEIHSYWVIDFTQPGKLVDAKQSLYLQSHDLPSPMGMFLTAVADRKKMGELSAMHKGDVLKWEEIIPRVLNHQIPTQ